MPIRLLLALIVGIFVAVPPLAQAHHQMDHFIGQTWMLKRLGWRGEWTRASISGFQGSYLTNTLSGGYVIDGTPIGFNATIPFHSVWPSGQTQNNGIGDIELSGRYQLVDSPRLVAGLSAELPTGDESKGLGSGHSEFTPYLLASMNSDPLIFFGTLGFLYSMEGHEHASGSGVQAASIVSRHASRELQLQAGAAYPLTEILYAALNVGSFTAIKSGDGVSGTSFFIGPQLALSHGAGRYRFETQIPVGGNRRFDFKGAFAVDFVF